MRNATSERTPKSVGWVFPSSLGIRYIDNMFKESRTSIEQNLFSSTNQVIGSKKLRRLNDKAAWFNVFYREVTSRIDEQIFRPLYADGKGRPNASIRMLVAMIILKEGQDWTDEQLYNACGFDLQVMRALGLTNLDDEVPVASTFYDFKSKLVRHTETTGEDLFGKLFGSLTSEQITRYSINGRSLRMDSKLIQSNIRKGSRLHKVLHGVQVFCKSLPQDWDKQIKKESDKSFLKQILGKSVTNHLYKMTHADKSDWLRRLGFLIRKLLNIYGSHDSHYHELLSQLYEEHYVEIKQSSQAQPSVQQEGSKDEQDDPPCRVREKEEMKADGIQSMHDPDAAYRAKGSGSNRKQVSGYSANITETTQEDLRLITAVQVKKATHPDCDFLEQAVKQSQQVTGQQVEQVHTDGGYDSIENRKRFANHIADEWHLANTCGGSAHRFKKDEHGNIWIYDPKVDKWLQTTMSRGGRYRISIEGRSAKYRYFTSDQVEAGLALAGVLPAAIAKGIRANVESTIHQVFHTLHGGSKSKYRGLVRNTLFVLSRSIWVNCKRIGVQTAQKHPFDHHLRLWLDQLITMVMKPSLARCPH